MVMGALSLFLSLSLSLSLSEMHCIAYKHAVLENVNVRRLCQWIRRSQMHALRPLRGGPKMQVGVLLLVGMPANVEKPSMCTSWSLLRDTVSLQLTVRD
jgi:hypothetical protein